MNFLEKINIKNKLFYKILFFLFFWILFFRLHNVLSFNPYWGYDGGGHIDYIISLASENKFPDINNNYLAWHEPLYYLIFAFFLKIFFFLINNPDIKDTLKFLGFLQVILSLCVSFLIYKLIILLSKKYNFSRGTIIVSLIIVNLLPSLNQASTFLTNELLNYFFILYAFYFFLKQFQNQEKIKIRDCFFLGIILGLGLLTKITILILILNFLIYFIIDFFINYRKYLKNKNLFGRLQKIFLIFFISFLIYSPWFVYRKNKLLDSFSINNTDFVSPQELKIDKRFLFFFGFDFDIFNFPYYYSGAKKFFSILYADFFWDYYGTIENKDFINKSIEHGGLNLIATTHNNNHFVSLRSYYLNRLLSILSIVVFFVFCFGFFNYLVKIRKVKNISLEILVPTSFLLGIIYYAYRYPYYDKGIVKAIFIFPVFIHLFPYGLAKLEKYNKKFFYLILVLIFFYFIILSLLYWIKKFNY